MAASTGMTRLDTLLEMAESHRPAVTAISFLLIAVIAMVDWRSSRM